MKRDLQAKAVQVRKLILQAVHKAGAGHVGGPLSMVEIAVAMYFKILRIDPKNSQWPDRDRYVLSKGHSCIALYATLALRGFFPVEEVFTYDAMNSRMQGHPDMTKTPGIDMSSGSLGTGASPPLGMALAAKRLGKDFHTWVHLGDGEIQEGQVWEMAFVASQYQVDNLTAIVDYNRVQQFGFPKDGNVRRRVNPLVQVPEKWRAFGWHVIECDGHDFDALIPACEEAKTIKGRPACIVAHTVKGKGVSFMEGDYNWHAKVPSPEELAKALVELDAALPVAAG
ncbi:MAG: transketolase [candidate division NC10 bacterium]|nr:transketolase [candidate division NC10 bacterium]MBI2561376.1 transketolase [candidate division NC10 bacterium]